MCQNLFWILFYSSKITGNNYVQFKYQKGYFRWCRLLHKQKFPKRGIIIFSRQTISSSKFSNTSLGFAPKHNKVAISSKTILNSFKVINFWHCWTSAKLNAPIQANYQQQALRSQHFQISSNFGTVEYVFSFALLNNVLIFSTAVLSVISLSTCFFRLLKKVRIIYIWDGFLFIQFSTS